MKDKTTLMQKIFELEDSQRTIDFLKQLLDVWPTDDEILKAAVIQKIATAEMVVANNDILRSVDNLIGTIDKAILNAKRWEAKR